MWKQIPGYSNYLINDKGDIYSIKSKRLIKQRVSKFGYYRAALFKEAGEKHEIMVHRLVAMAFLENPANLPQVNHKNENKTDNRVENLEWCTCSYNINYGNRNKTVSRKLAKIKEKTAARKILQIDIMTKKTIKVWKSMHEIERKLGIPHSNIYACCTGKRKTRGGYIWKYATGKEEGDDE